MWLARRVAAPRRKLAVAVPVSSADARVAEEAVSGVEVDGAFAAVAAVCARVVGS